jgi:hypothetical protein
MLGFTIGRIAPFKNVPLKIPYITPLIVEMEIEFSIVITP